MNNQGFDVGVHTAQRWRTVRRWALLVLSLAFFVDTYGLLNLRVTYAKSGDRRHSGQYLGVGGIRALQLENCPLLILVPLKRPVVSYVVEILNNLREN